MRNLLNVVCLALSIYYVFTAPTSMAAPTRKPKTKPTTGQVREIIHELGNLGSAFESTAYIRSLNETNSIKELSCRAHGSIQALNNQKLKRLERLLYFFTEGNCANVTDGKHESEEDINSFIHTLLEKFKNYFSLLKK